MAHHRASAGEGASVVAGQGGRQIMRGPRTAACAVFIVLAGATGSRAQDATDPSPPQDESTVQTAAKFLLGGAAGLLAHEGGHLLANVSFGAKPYFHRIEFHGIPFFAIGHREPFSPAREFVISSAGFWVQHAGNEWILTRRPQLRRERAPFTKGVLAFNVLASVAYAGAAFGRTGPAERDTRGMAIGARIDERWIGALILTPAVLDAWRYFEPEARWARWMARGAKVGIVLVTIRARRS